MAAPVAPAAPAAPPLPLPLCEDKFTTSNGKVVRFLDKDLSLAESLAECKKAKSILLPMHDVVFANEIKNNIKDCVDSTGGQVNRNQVAYRVGLKMKHGAGWWSDGQPFKPDVENKLFLNNNGANPFVKCQEVYYYPEGHQLYWKQLFADKCGFLSPSLCMESELIKEYVERDVDGFIHILPEEDDMTLFIVELVIISVLLLLYSFIWYIGRDTFWTLFFARMEEEEQKKEDSEKQKEAAPRGREVLSTIREGQKESGSSSSSSIKKH